MLPTSIDKCNEVFNEATFCVKTQVVAILHHRSPLSSEMPTNLPPKPQERGKDFLLVAVFLRFDSHDASHTPHFHVRMYTPLAMAAASSSLVCVALPSSTLLSSCASSSSCTPRTLSFERKRERETCALPLARDLYLLHDLLPLLRDCSSDLLVLTT